MWEQKAKNREQELLDLLKEMNKEPGEVQESQTETLKSDLKLAETQIFRLNQKLDEQRAEFERLDEESRLELIRLQDTVTDGEEKRREIEASLQNLQEMYARVDDELKAVRSKTEIAPLDGGQQKREVSLAADDLMCNFSLNSTTGQNDTNETTLKEDKVKDDSLISVDPLKNVCTDMEGKINELQQALEIKTHKMLQKIETLENSKDILREKIKNQTEDRQTELKKKIADYEKELQAKIEEVSQLENKLKESDSAMLKHLEVLEQEIKNNSDKILDALKERHQAELTEQFNKIQELEAKIQQQHSTTSLSFFNGDSHQEHELEVQKLNQQLQAEREKHNMYIGVRGKEILDLEARLKSALDSQLELQTLNERLVKETCDLQKQLQSVKVNDTDEVNRILAENYKLKKEFGQKIEEFEDKQRFWNNQKRDIMEKSHQLQTEYDEMSNQVSLKNFERLIWFFFNFQKIFFAANGKH